MAHSLRRNSCDLTSSTSARCHRCQLDIEADPQCNGRLRILCPFCGEFLVRGNITNIQMLKDEIDKKVREEEQQQPSLRSRFSRTFHRVIFRRQSSLNNNGIASSHRREKNVIMPPITSKQPIVEQVNKENLPTTSLPMIATATTTTSFSIYNFDEFQSLINNENVDQDQINRFYSMFYSNFLYTIQTLTKTDNNNQQVMNWQYLQSIHNYVIKNAAQLSRLVLKTIASTCIRETRSCDTTLKGYIILLMAPVFDDQSNNHIFAHILRRIAHFNDREHHEIVVLLQTLPVEMFRSIVVRLQNFVSTNLFPSRIENNSSTLTNGWWIPCAVRTLALFNQANEQIEGQRKVPLNEMNIDALNYIDGERDYFEWKHRQTRGATNTGFTFCQYPFVFSVNAKRTILKRDSEQQMVFNARRSMIQKFQNKQAPNLNMLFLNLYIRRSHLLLDSLAEVTKKRDDLKKKLRVTFVGENGLDMGGLTKEWFLLLLRQIFLPDYGMFVYYDSAGVFWFNGASHDNIREYNLVGILMGLAVYNAIILDIRFPSVCYKKLLTPAYLPDSATQRHKTPVGIVKPTIADFRTIRPEIAKSLQYLLDYDGNVQEDFGLTFEVSVAQFDTTVVYSLKENGSNIDVTNANREEYVQLLMDFYLNKHIMKQFEAFYYGFHSVCSSNALLLLVPEELEMLICGMEQCHLSDLAKITKYENCHVNENFIKWFWEVVEEMPMEKQRRLLLFVTGSDRMPIGGLTEMTFKIGKIVSNRSNINDLLPMSHTCFNQLLLPAYPTREILKEKLLLAIENCEGFGIE